MADEGLNKLGEFRTESGEVVGKVFSAPNALTDGADSISQCLYVLTEMLVRGLFPDKRGGGLGGEFGYGIDFENDVFLMFRECWCDGEPGCKKCEGGFPNFRHKASGFEVEWYKWIGRSMEMNRDGISGEEWHKIFRECVDSIPQEARDKAQKEHDYENTAEYKEAAELQMKSMFTAMSNMKDQSEKNITEGKWPREAHCKSCGIHTWRPSARHACGVCKVFTPKAQQIVHDKKHRAKMIKHMKKVFAN